MWRCSSGSATMPRSRNPGGSDTRLRWCSRPAPATVMEDDGCGVELGATFIGRARGRRACRDDDRTVWAAQFAARTAFTERGCRDTGRAFSLGIGRQSQHRDNRCEVHSSCPGGTRCGADYASLHGTAPRRNRDLGAVSPRQSILTQRAKTGYGLGGTKRNSALVTKLAAQDLCELARRNQSSPLSCSSSAKPNIILELMSEA